MSQLLGSDFRLIPGESGDRSFAARAAADCTSGILRAADLFAERDLCRTYGTAADPFDQARYKAQRRTHWVRYLLDGSPLLPAPDDTGEHGARWVSDPEGAWEVAIDDCGATDIWTHPVDALQPDERRALGWALLAADGWHHTTTSQETSP